VARDCEKHYDIKTLFGLSESETCPQFLYIIEDIAPVVDGRECQVMLRWKGVRGPGTGVARMKQPNRLTE
jgi:hypothetical protein